MAEGFINVSEGAGKKAHTWNRTIGANSVEDEFVIPGEFPYPTYGVTTGLVSTATTADHVLQIMAGASLPVRIRRIRIEQANNATAAGIIAVTVLRLATAGTGGTVITPRPFDSADAASGATAMSLPTAKGTEGVTLMATIVTLRQTVATAGAQFDDAFEWTQLSGSKALIIPAGTANGIALKLGTGIAGATLQINAEIVETNFV